MYKYIISSHLNPNLSGVAKFNQILANKLDITSLGFADDLDIIQGFDHLLVSVKLNDTFHADINYIKNFIQLANEKKITFDIFFHSFDGLELEYELMVLCSRVYCANPELVHALDGFDKELVEAWCPSLVDSDKAIEPATFNIFSFGMAHKLQLRFYKMLNEKLSTYNNLNYSIWISTAFHEKSSFGQFNTISNQLNDIFAGKINFVGFLSDEGINYFLDKIQLFVGFFPKGVRSNNTSIYVPMGKGVPVLTNLDEYSPKWMKAGINILDIHHIKEYDLGPKSLKEISEKARKDIEKYASWDSLVNLLQSKQ